MVESTEGVARTDTRTKTTQSNTSVPKDRTPEGRTETTKPEERTETTRTVTKVSTEGRTETRKTKIESHETNGRTESTRPDKTVSKLEGRTETRGKTETRTKTDRPEGRTETRTSKGVSNLGSKGSAEGRTEIVMTETREIKTKAETVKPEGKIETHETKDRVEAHEPKDMTETREIKGKTKTVEPRTRTKVRESKGRTETQTSGNESSKGEDDATERTSGDGDTTSGSLFQDSNVPEVVELLDRLNSEELTALRIHFYEKKVDEKIKEPKGSAHPRFRGFKLKRDEFIFAIESVLATKDFEETAGILFDDLTKENAEEHKGFLWWEQILDELIDFMAEKTKSRPGNVVKESFCSLYPIPHCRRETIVRVVPIETSSSFCYVVVSKYGKVGIYDWNMILLEQYEVRLSTQIATTAGGEVRRTTWVTDALFMDDASTLLVAASDRSLHFYATTGLVCVPVYHISGLPNAPTCLHYTESTSPETPSMLLVGDDHGSIATMYFQQPHYALFKRTSNDALDRYFWKELSSMKTWVIISMDYGIHKDEITRVEYFSDNNTVVSCSNDPNTTVAIRYIVGRRAPYVFRVARGVRCFHLDRTLRLLATGGKDSVVRLWNPIIPRKPVASLFGHKCCIVDVRILKQLNAIISMSKDTVVKVWDIEGQTCMQSLPLLFPVHGMLARVPEFGVRSFYQGPVTCKQPHLTIKASTEIVLSPRSLTTDSSFGLTSSGVASTALTSNGLTSSLTLASDVQASEGLVSDSLKSPKSRPTSVGTASKLSKSNTTIKTKTETGISSRTVSGKSKSTVTDEVNSQAAQSTSKVDEESARTRSAENEKRTLSAGSKRTVSKVSEKSQKADTRTMTQRTATERSEDEGSCMSSPWTRMEVLAVCCNFIAILQLSERELDDGEEKRVGDSLHPPLRNQDPAAPSPWLTVDPALLTGLTDIDAPPQPDDAVAPTVPAAVLATLQKSLGDDMTRDFTALAANCHGRESQQTDLKQIRAMVEQCAPHLALGSAQVEEMPFIQPASVHVHQSRRKAENAHERKAEQPARPSVAGDDSASSPKDNTTETNSTSTKSTRNQGSEMQKLNEF